MKALFLTSSLGGYTKTIEGNEVVEHLTQCNNSNHFIDRLKRYVTKINTFVFIASNPDGTDKTDKYSKNIVASLNLDGFDIRNLVIIDHRFEGDIKKTILNADVVFLAGGSVPTQNKYFKEIGLKTIINKYNGVVIGQSAGSMNCNSIVYAQPEEDEEFEDKNHKIKLDGLGLVDFSIMPHMNSANDVDELNHPTVMEMCLRDSYDIPHYGIVDYGFIEVVDRISTAYGKTTYYKNGKEYSVCENGEHVKIENEFNCDKVISV